MAKSPLTMLVIAVFGAQMMCGGGEAFAQGIGLFSGITDMIDKALTGFKYCPPPYFHVLGECYYVHQYIPQLSWEEAQIFCKQMGGIGAEPEHFGAIIAQLFNMGKSKEIFGGELVNIWLGGRREDNSTIFRWATSGHVIDDVADKTVTESVDSPVLAPGYFSDIGYGDCVMMELSRQGPSGLRPRDCTARVHYACQIP